MASPAPVPQGPDPSPTLPLKTAPDPPVATSRAKRMLDLAGGAVLAVVFLPIALVIALVIRLDSRGPILFRQARVGLRGRRFTMLKFRSMHADCDDAPHREYVTGLVNGERESTQDGAFKLNDDARVTRVGSWLRRSSLDEIPQLVNVLRGHMSLVGPRPPLPYEVEHYDARQMRRLTAPPGLTGLWQVAGRSQLSYRSMVDLDLEYIDRWSLALDLRVLLRTVPVVLKNTGSAR